MRRGRCGRALDESIGSEWRGRRVLVTGHTGFKGGWLCLWLQALGAEVCGYALAPDAEPCMFTAAHVADGMTSVIGDVLDRAHLAAAMAEFQPEAVFHLAAQALVGHSYADPINTYAVNVMGTAHLLDTVRGCDSARAVVVVTSDKCYDNKEWVWGYRENEPMGGHDPYSSSKGCAELVVAACRASFFGPGRHGAGVATARAGNVVGGGDWARGRLVPDVLRALMGEGTSGSPPLTLRRPQAVRPWQHVLEPLGGYLALAQALLARPQEYAEGWNFGPGAEAAQTVANVVAQTTALWGGSSEAVQYAPQPQYHEAHFLALDCAKAAARLGWRPRLTLAEALSLTVDWARAWQAGANMRATSLAQIAAYEAKETPE